MAEVMKENELYRAIRKIAWGYLFLHIDFNLGTIDILPSWVGYIFFLQSLSVIAKEEESAKLLAPLGKFLAAAEGLFWVNKGVLGGYFNFYLVSIVISVISLYFHFQFLTNLSDIAKKYECKEEKTILNLRTVKTILTTILCLMLSIEMSNTISIGIAIVSVVVALWMCSTLFSFSRSILKKLKEREQTQEEEVIL